MLSLIVALSLGREGAARGFFLPFDASKYMFAFTPVYARAQATPVAGLAEFLPQVLRLFHTKPGPGAEGSLRIALDVGRGEWLYVDEEGHAQIGRRRGSFDVIGWARLLRRSRTLRALPRTDLVELSVVNRTTVTTVVTDTSGSPILTVPAHGTATTTSWFRRHLFLQNGRMIGMTDKGLALSELPTKERPMLRIERTKTSFSSEHSGGVPVRFSVKDS